MSKVIIEKVKEVILPYLEEENIIFGGRLGHYKYYDMDKVIEAALNCVNELV